MSLEELESRLKVVLEQNAALQEAVNNANRDNPAPSEQHNHINKVAVRLPPFWFDKPNVWFAQAEAQFTLAGITSDSTRYNHVVAQLDTRLAAEVEDIITNPPKDGAYLVLRAELTRRLSRSDGERVRQLIRNEELGDRRPSQFLRHLKSLAGETPDLTMLKQLWLTRLPTHVQAILSSHAELGLEKLADLADSIIEVSPANPMLHAATKSSQPEPSDWMLNLASRVDMLCQHLSVSAVSPHPGRPRSRSRPRYPRERSHSRSTTPTLCWYHKRYQANAQRCTTPCTWMDGSPSQSNANSSQ
jgi:hypothetical protein